MQLNTLWPLWLALTFVKRNSLHNSTGDGFTNSEYTQRRPEQKKMKRTLDVSCAEVAIKALTVLIAGFAHG
jgi:hypothetical protein